MWVEPRFWEQVAPYRFHRTPTRHDQRRSSNLRAASRRISRSSVDAPAGVDYTFIDKVLPFDRIAGQAAFYR